MKACQHQAYSDRPCGRCGLSERTYVGWLGEIAGEIEGDMGSDMV